jgi:hypothetical protein
MASDIRCMGIEINISDLSDLGDWAKGFGNKRSSRLVSASWYLVFSEYRVLTHRQKQDGYTMRICEE